MPPTQQDEVRCFLTAAIRKPVALPEQRRQAVQIQRRRTKPRCTRACRAWAPMMVPTEGVVAKARPPGIGMGGADSGSRRTKAVRHYRQSAGLNVHALLMSAKHKSHDMSKRQTRDPGVKF